MLIIKEVSSDIHASLEDAETYLGRAMETYVEHPKLADAYFKIYKDHKSEVMELHEQVVSLIKEQNISNVNEKVLDVMKSIWEWEHKQLMDRMYALDKKEARYQNLKSKR